MDELHEEILDAVRALRSVLPETVHYIVETTQDCQACGWDPVTKSSTNPFCTVCGGKGRVSQTTAYPILSHVNRYTGTEFVARIGGTIPAGTILVDCLKEDMDAVSIKPSDIRWIEVDGQRYQIQSVRQDKIGDFVFGYTFRCFPASAEGQRQ